MALHHDIELEVEQGIARFTVNKSATHNALTLDMLRALDAVFAQLEAREDICCIVFSSTSERFFAAARAAARISKNGGILTLKKWAACLSAPAIAFFAVFGRWTLPPLRSCPAMPSAGGGGLELVLACDFRYAVEGIKLGLPEASLGAIPGWLGAQRLYALAGASRMHHLVMLGETITAQQALEWGTVQAVVAGE